MFLSNKIGVSRVSEAVKKHVESNGEFRDVCWICEGWRPHTFKWTKDSGPVMSEPIFLHLSYEGFKDRYLARAKGYNTERMIPPIGFNYFFSVENCQVCAQDQNRHPPKDPIVHVDLEFISYLSSPWKTKTK